MTTKYNEEETRELTLYIENTGDIYRALVTPLINSLAKRIIKGNYDKTLATKSFYNIATFGAKEYCRQFGGVYYEVFSVADRKETAERLLEGYNDLINETVENLKNNK